MVQILPPKTNLGSQVGQSLAQGLQQGMQQGFQRGMLQQALKKIEGLGQTQPGQKETSPFELASALISATAGIPGAERYVGQLFPLLLSQLQNQKFGEIPSAGGGMPGAPNQGQGISPQMGANVQQEGAPQAQPQPISTQNQLTQMKNSLPLPLPEPTMDLFGNAPEDIRYGSGPKPVTYSEDEYRQVEQNYRTNNLDPAPAINFMQRQDEVARNRYNDILKGVDVEYNLQEKRAASQTRVRDTLSNQLGIKEPRLLAVADRLGRRKEFASIPDEFRRAEALRSELDKYVGTEAEFKKASMRPNPIFSPEKYSTKKQTMKTMAQRMIDYGQRDEVYKDLAQNGWSETEIANALNPLSEDVKKKIDTIPHYALSRSEGEGRIFKDRSALEQSNKKIQSVLTDVIKPGKTNPKDPDVLKPGTSLILLKKALMKKGMSADDFDRVLSQLVNERRINLDAEQSRELNVMTGEPYRVQSIYELVTGQ